MSAAFPPAGLAEGAPGVHEVGEDRAELLDGDAQRVSEAESRPRVRGERGERVVRQSTQEVGEPLQSL